MILDQAGVEVGAVSAPWAVDANGVPVPTWFELDGMTLVQTVDHTNGDIAYPVLVDPCWGWSCLAGVVEALVVGAVAGAAGGAAAGAVFGPGAAAGAGAVSVGTAAAVVEWWF